MRFDIRPGVRRLLRFPIRTRAAMKRDADDELEALIAFRVEHLIARGMSPDDARAEAIHRLGASLDQVRHQLHTNATQRERRMRIVELFESVMQDVRYAARGLARRPAFTTVAVFTLAIGVGATTAIFSAVNVLILRPLPYARPDELMKVSLVLPAEGGHPALTPGFAYPTYTALRDAQRGFNRLAAYSPTPATLTSGDVERVDGEYVSASYLRTLGLALVAVGVVIGLAGAFAVTRVLRTFLFDLTPSDPVTYAAILVVLGVTAVLASWVPGLRASRVDPVIALRAE